MILTTWSVNLILAVTGLVLLIYLFLKRRYQYWERRGVPYLKPNLFFGNLKDVVWQDTSKAEHHRNLYNKLAPHRFAGYFRFQRPALIIRDPELLRHILVQDFPHFNAHNKNFQIDKDPLSFHLFNLYGEKWKLLRSKLTPTFTSGKMKLMYHLMKECADGLDKLVDKSIQDNPELEMKELLARYSTDVISSCAFGLQANSLQVSETEFRNVGRKLLQEMNFTRRMFVLLSFFSPKLVKMLGMTFVDRDMMNFFLNLVADTVRYREKNNIRRNDFLSLLMGLRNEDKSSDYNNGLSETAKSEAKIEMTLELMAAQCFIFFVGGFETSSSVLSTCLLELAKHQDVQEKLRQEIDAVLKENGGQLNYDVLHSMCYMEKVVSEALRMYPPLSFLFRQCTKRYRIPDSEVIIEEDTELYISIYGIHRNPQYFPNPDEFNPENFSEENKASRPPFTYLPFGDGPRICIGSRFALMQVKLGLAALLKNYRFTVSPKMKLPVKFVPKSFAIIIKDGTWLNCSKR